MKISNTLLPVLAAFMLTACGGGSSDGGSPQDPTINVGRFVDSAVTGLRYTTDTQSGSTSNDGSFNYVNGEAVTFSIGDIALPATPAAELLTPMSLFSTNDITDIRVMNLARLLQTLDIDGNPENGIVISDAAHASASGMNVDFSANDFDDQVVNLIANSGSVTSSLVGGIDALNHLQETLFVEGIEERPPLVMTQEPSTNGTPNTAEHPAVGTSAIFSNFSHDISGRMTVIDDRTIEISNFSYDGGGITVFFYTGVDGNYRSGRPIGPQLNGRTYNNETITLTIPSDLTLDDFNGLSVWCVPFAINFGDAQL